jgi:hypothetical protein
MKIDLEEIACRRADEQMAEFSPDSLSQRNRNDDDIRNSPPRDRPTKRPCLAGDCDRPIRHRGYCGKHGAQVFGINSAGVVNIIRITNADLYAMRHALRRMERGHRVAQRGSGWRNGPSPEVHR